MTNGGILTIKVDKKERMISFEESKVNFDDIQLNWYLNLSLGSNYNKKPVEVRIKNFELQSSSHGVQTEAIESQN